LGLTVGEARVRTTTPQGSEQVVELVDVAWSSPVEELDLTLVRLAKAPDGAIGLDAAQRLPIVERQDGALQVDLSPDAQPRVFVVGHPNGRKLAYCLDGMLLDHDDDALQYLANTAPGSGGSPVFNRLWQVIGMHRLSGEIPRLNGEGLVDACQGLSMPAIRRALNEALD
jgi:hypothetical protein